MAKRNILVRLFSAIWQAADGLRKVLHLLVLLFVFAIVVAALSSSAPKLPAKAALHLPLYGQLVEQLDGDPFDRAVAELMDEAPPQILVQDIVDALKFAENDKRIRAVVLDVGGLTGGGLSKLQRIGRAITDYREATGKPVIAHGDYFSQAAYFLAAHADDVYMHPEGLLVLQGFSAYRNYYKDALDTLKVDWNVFRAGTYKSAVEPFLRNDMSGEDRSSLSRILSQLWNVYRDGVSVARELPAENVDTLIADFPALVQRDDLTPAGIGVELGFVDELLTRNEVRQRIAEHAGSDEDSPLGYNAANLQDYVANSRLLAGPGEHEQNIAVIVASGEILDGHQPPGTIGGESTAALLARARKDENVSAVVLRVDSPGGSAFASEVIRHEILALQDAGKPVVASMGSVAASGGYWISMAADRIYASESTITGSIGVFGMFPTFERSLDALGVHTDGVATSALAGALRPDRAMSDETKRIVQALVDSDYDEFISRVAKHRGLEKDAVDRIAQGQVWTGRDALDNGLVDAIGDFDDAVLAAADLGGLEEGSYGKVYYEKELTPTELLALQFLGAAEYAGIDLATLSGRQAPLQRLAAMIDRAVQPFLRFNDPRGVYAYCLCNVAL